MKNCAKASSEQWTTRFKKSDYVPWAEKFSQAIDIVIGTLETLIERWTAFCGRSVLSYFDGAEMRSSLQGIEDNFTHMNDELLRDLYQLKKACDSYKGDVRKFPDLHELSLNWLILILAQTDDEPAEPVADAEL